MSSGLLLSGITFYRGKAAFREPSSTIIVDSLYLINSDRFEFNLKVTLLIDIFTVTRFQIDSI